MGADRGSFDIRDYATPIAVCISYGRRAPGEVHRELVTDLRDENVDLSKTREVEHHLHVPKGSDVHALVRDLRERSYFIQFVVDDAEYGRWLVFASEWIVCSEQILSGAHARLDAILAAYQGVQLAVGAAFRSEDEDLCERCAKPARRTLEWFDEEAYEVFRRRLCLDCFEGEKGASVVVVQ